MIWSDRSAVAIVSSLDKRATIDAPWSKIKFDRQIVAIAKVNGATAIYSDDDKLIEFARTQDIPCTKIADLPIPESARQIGLPFQPQPPDPENDSKAPA